MVCLRFILMYDYHAFSIRFGSGNISVHSIDVSLFCFLLHNLLRCLGSLSPCSTLLVLSEPKASQQTSASICGRWFSFPRPSSVIDVSSFVVVDLYTPLSGRRLTLLTSFIPLPISLYSHFNEFSRFPCIFFQMLYIAFQRDLLQTLP